MKEIWKPVVGWEKFYSVSNFGSVRSENGKNCGKILKPQKSNWGYFRVLLSNKKIRKKFTIHTLVVRAFLGKCPAGLETNHKDGCKQNNFINNLEYISKSQNQLHAIKLGLCKHNKGESHYNSRLKEKQILEIRKLYFTGKYTLEYLGLKFKVGFKNISKIVNKYTWKHI